MSNVVSLSGERADIDARCEAVIELCEKLIDGARNGTIVGLAYSSVLSDGSVFVDWTPGCGPEILGGVTILQHKMVAASE
jgi:hypothetical protein